MASKFEGLSKIVAAKQARRLASRPKPSTEAARKKRLKEAARATLKRQIAARNKRRK